jgi:ectoine hydroxylase-related dioxygenase (phytanoyl-CoA dioxygenase family)
VAESNFLEREVTDEEAAFFQEHGWVFLPNLLPRETCELILEDMKRRMGESGEEVSDPTRVTRPRGAAAKGVAEFAEYYYPSRDNELLHRLTYSERAGLNAHRLMGRDVGVLYHYDLIGCKIPEQREGGTGPTLWHQDDPSLPFDRDGGLVVWLALADLTPDMGTLRFVDRSLRQGRLGRLNLNLEGADPFEVYPRLKELDISPPLTHSPGDATVHHGLTLHSAPANTSDDPRWVFIRGYLPADVRYTGAPWLHFKDLDVKVDQLIEHPRFPLLYEGAAPRGRSEFASAKGPA